jgi:hypothetical protein
MKLLAVYVGGDIKGANIELHDMRFVVAESIDDSHEELRRQWWGTPGSLHIDCWAELTHADGYAITLKPEPFTSPEKLFYVNLGGYEENEFTEMHKNMFVVAETESKAKLRALKTVRHWRAFHKDDIYQADQVFSLNQQAREQGLYLHLQKIEDDVPLSFTCSYVNIGRKR